MTRKHGTAKSEAAEIKRMGAKAQSNSGRGKINKGDAVIDGYYLVDVKESAKGFTVSQESWSKLCTDAVRSGNYEPVFNIVLGQPGSPRTRLYVITEEEFNDLRTLRRMQLNVTIEDEQ
jgi:hypothetical protein